MTTTKELQLVSVDKLIPYISCFVSKFRYGSMIKTNIKTATNTSNFE